MMVMIAKCRKQRRRALTVEEAEEEEEEVVMESDLVGVVEELKGT